MKHLFPLLAGLLVLMLLHAAEAANVAPIAAVLKTTTGEAAGSGPDWLHILQNPNIFFLLMSGAVYGLLIEFSHPGVVLPGFVGAVCLLLTVYVLQDMKVDYTGLALMVAGMGLMAAEAFIPAFGALAVGGAVAFVTGAVMLQHAGLGIDLWLVGVMTALNFAVLTFFLSLAVKAQRLKPRTGQEALLSASADVLEWSQGRGDVRVAGETWKARTDGSGIIEKGGKVKIVAVDGLTLVVEPEKI